MALEDVQDNVHQIELDIETAQRMIRKRDTVQKLKQDPAFREVFIDGYLHDEAARLVGLKCDPEMQDEERQRFVEQSILGISTFNQYLMTIQKLGDMAENSMRSAQRYREQLLEEDRAGAGETH